MSKCNKVKNPCKICLGSVNAKTGLQCQGACATWVHFSCLNYTPGKIKDIKAGIIKVTCPCPDCKTTLPKEYRTDQPYSCTNTMCPANRPPKCDNMRCPINDSSINPDQSCAPPCPLSTCGTECKQNSTPHIPNSPKAPMQQPCVPANPSSGPPYKISSMSSDPCFGPSLCASRCSSISSPDIPGDYRSSYVALSAQSPQDSRMPSAHMVEDLCNTVGQLTTQINDLMFKMKLACNEKDRGGGGAAKNRPNTKDCPNTKYCPGKGGAGAVSPRSQGGPRTVCPKPCFCPGNPIRRDNY